MKLINKILILVLFTGLFSCSDYLDINTDPTKPTAGVVGPDLVLPAAQNGSYAALAGTQNNFGNIMMNQWAGDVTNFTGGNTDEYRFNLTSTFYAAIWNNQYLVTDKLQAVINKNSAENVYFAAIGKILKAHNMQYIADLYDSAPYSEAFQRGENFQPKYDTALDIYKALYTELDEAVAMINGADAAVAINPGANDVMLGGNMAMWVKFANTLKLKLLVRASSSSNGDAQSFVSGKFPSLASAQFLGVGDNITINPGYAADTGKQNYFWDRYGFTSGGDQTQSNKFIVGSQYFVDYLLGNGNVTPIAPYDARIEAYFTIASKSTTYQGVTQGADDPVDPTIGLSYIGPGLLSSADQNGLFFSAAESLFLQAEAAMNGKIPGNAGALFNAGIQSSFDYYSKDATAYLAGIAALPKVGWAGSNSDKLEAIMRQKWTALHSIDGLETLIEHNRTGFPNPPLPTLASTDRPFRLLYPTSELTGNSLNVPSVTKAQAFTPSIFWQK